MNEQAQCRPAVNNSFFGDHKAVARPDPIPNSAVKHSLADGSGSIGSARVGRRQFFLKAEALISFGFLFCSGPASSKETRLKVSRVRLIVQSD